MNEGNEGDFNASPVNAASINALQQAGSAADLSLANANGRVYAVHADGNDHAGGPYVDGWPVKLGLLMSELLPVVGEGVNGSPVIAPLTCPQGGEGRKVGVIPAAGLGYVLNGDGTSCMESPDERETALQSDVPGQQGVDANRFPAVGPARVRHDRRAHDLPGARRRAGARTRSCRQRVPRRCRRTGGMESRDGPVHAQLPGTDERPVLPDRPRRGRCGRPPGRGGPGRHGEHGPPGVQRGGRACDQPLAATARRLDGGHAADRLLRSEGDGRGRDSDRGSAHAPRHGVRLRHARPGLLARLLAPLSPRQPQLRRLRARRRGAGQAGGV